MENRTIVSIYEVDEGMASGQWAGQGSLVNSGIVLVHPPLSDRIVEGKGPERLRVGIYPADEHAKTGEVVEVIDVWGQPHVLRQGTAEETTIVALELCTPARSPEYTIPDVDWTAHDEEDYQAIAKHLRTLSESDGTPSEGGEILPIGGTPSEGGEILPSTVYHLLFCRLFGKCKH